MAKQATEPSTGTIIVRQFQPRDEPQVHALLIEGLVYGSDSPRNAALRQSLTSRISLVVYTGFAVGIGCFWSSHVILRACGVLLCLFAAALLGYYQRSITKMFVDYCANARKADMADIMDSYELSLSANGLSAQKGPGGFWVAVIESPEHNTAEVVGTLGLDHRGTPDPATGELRRMIVSMRHRRRKIGTLLMDAALEHARRFAPLLQTLDLETTNFQPGARMLYEKYGFVVVSTRTMHMSPLFSMTAFRYRRKVAQ
ncbi:acyl-CoA N-acyltransferase [Mycena olivaceomarginata]|nr:acyl-CoA N-acyltransferase [Mycena olivaceomarginata]